MTIKKDIIDELHMLDQLGQWDDTNLAPHADKIIEIFYNAIDSIPYALGMELHCQLAVNYAKDKMKWKLQEIFTYDDGTFTAYKNNTRKGINCKLCTKLEYTNSKVDDYSVFVCDECKQKLRNEIQLDHPTNSK